MSLTLHLGVIDIPYPNSKEGETTAQVATYLEDRYHIKQVFFEMQGPGIAAELEEGLAESLETLLMGAPSQADIFAGACDQIDQMFRTFLSEDEMSYLGMKGTPTKAARMGINHRFKKPRTGNPRPSFIDTGLYRANSKSWVD